MLISQPIHQSNLDHSYPLLKGSDLPPSPLLSPKFRKAFTYCGTAPKIFTNPILLLDGALGTVLEKAPYNILFNENTPLWSSHLLLTNPDIFQDVHRSYIDAGADIIQAATYQASVLKDSPEP